jgi:hypothetical protein
MGFQWISDLGKEVKQVTRGLLRSPGFTVAAVATMGLSIGAITTVFSVIEAVLLCPLPYRNPKSRPNALVRSPQQGYSTELDFLSGHTGLDTPVPQLQQDCRHASCGFGGTY